MPTFQSSRLSLRNRRSAVVAGGAVALLVASIVVFHPWGEGEPRVGKLESGSGTRSDPDGPRLSSVSKSTHSHVQEPSSRDLGYQWNPLDPGIAASQADAQWLDRHGFPGPDSEKYLLGLPISQLRELAERGSLPAQGVYAFRMAQAGHSNADVQQILLTSAASGSVYALKMAGDIYVAVEGFRDPVMASVFYGLQARGGDHAGFSLQYQIDARLGADERLRARVMREAMWRSIDTLRRHQGRQPVPLDARPGFDEFLNRAIQPTSNRP